MGAIDRDGYRFEPEYSVINQKGAIHVYYQGEFLKEIPFSFDGERPEHDQIESIVAGFFHEKSR